MNNFIAQCLNKNFEERPTASELLKHDFIHFVPSDPKMASLYAEAVQFIHFKHIYAVCIQNDNYTIVAEKIDGPDGHLPKCKLGTREPT